MGRAHHSGDENVGRVALRRKGVDRPQGSAESCSSGSDSAERQESAEEDPGAGHLSSRCRMGVGVLHEAAGADEWGSVSSGSGSPGHPYGAVGAAGTDSDRLEHGVEAADPEGHTGEGVAVLKGPGEYTQGNGAGQGRGAWGFGGGVEGNATGTNRDDNDDNTSGVLKREQDTDAEEGRWHGEAEVLDLHQLAHDGGVHRGRGRDTSSRDGMGRRSSRNGELEVDQKTKPGSCGWGRSRSRL